MFISTLEQRWPGLLLLRWEAPARAMLQGLGQDSVWQTSACLPCIVLSRVSAQRQTDINDCTKLHPWALRRLQRKLLERRGSHCFLTSKSQGGLIWERRNTTSCAFPSGTWTLLWSAIWLQVLSSIVNLYPAPCTQSDLSEVVWPGTFAIQNKPGTLLCHQHEVEVTERLAYWGQGPCLLPHFSLAQCLASWGRSPIHCVITVG